MSIHYKFPHPHTTLPGHDPSKVRGADCITASASEALDVRVLQCIETLLIIDRKDVHSAFRNARAGQYARLQTIAAEIRDAATPPSSRTTATLIAELTNATTEPTLARAWRDVAPSLRTMTVSEQLAGCMAFITRLCTMKRGQG